MKIFIRRRKIFRTKIFMTALVPEVSKETTTAKSIRTY